MLRTQVLFWLAEYGGSTVGVTSPSSGDGKTLTAVNLAVQIAAAVDYTVLLVDANLRAPAVDGCFGWPPMPGLTDRLLGDVPLEQLLLQSGIDRLAVLPAGGARPQDSAELLGSHAMGVLVDELAHRWGARIVVFDLPAALETSDVLAFSPHVDGLLLVARQGATHKRELARAQALLPSHKQIGVALNTGGPPRKRSLLGRLLGD